MVSTPIQKSVNASQIQSNVGTPALAPFLFIPPKPLTVEAGSAGVLMNVQTRAANASSHSHYATCMAKYGENSIRLTLIASEPITTPL